MSPSTTSSIWTKLPSKVAAVAKHDEEFLALLHDTDVVFGVATNESPTSGLITTVKKGKASFTEGDPTPGKQEGSPQFSLFATEDQWNKFLQLVPPFPCQSYFGLFGMNM
jgi:hypothetical protein